MSLLRAAALPKSNHRSGTSSIISCFRDVGSVDMWLPKEHGAYGQVGFPLATAFGVAGVSTAGLLLSMTVIAAFVAHEPAAVGLGLRGSRAQRESGTYARRWLACCLVVGIAAGVAAVILLDPVARRSLAIPAIPAVLLIVAMVQGREKSWYGEAAAALAFAGASIPVVLAAGAPMDTALAVAIQIGRAHV